MELTIKTKFDYKDEVWFMYANLPRSAFVQKVDVSVSSYRGELIPRTECYNLEDKYGSLVEDRQYHAFELFASELELCQSLFYNCIKKD